MTFEELIKLSILTYILNILAHILFKIFRLHLGSTYVYIFQIKINGLSYFKSVWNILDVTVIVISIVFLAFDVYRTLEVDKKLEELTKKPDQFQDFEFLSLWQIRFDNAIAITVFLAWVKVTCFTLLTLCILTV